MKKKKEEVAIETTLGMSRRAVLKAASVIAAGGLTAGLPQIADAASATTGIDYGTGNNLGPTNVYPLLAAWLILTTNGDPGVDFPIPGSLGTVAGLGGNTYGYIMDNFYNDCAYKQAFVLVRTAFLQVARHFAATPAPGSPNPYGGGICPDKACVIQRIASINTAC